MRSVGQERAGRLVIRRGVADALRAHGGDGFVAALQRILSAQPEADLPIRGDHGGRVDPSELTLTLLAERAVDVAGRALTEIRVGVLFTETMGGCSCGDEPFTVSGYQELTLLIDWGACTLEVRDNGR